MRNAAEGDPSGDYPQEGFVFKLAPDGRTLEYSTYVGGSQQDAAAKIAIGPDGAAYVIASTNSADFTATTTFVPVALKLDPAGQLAWSDVLGYGTAAGIAVDGQGQTIVAGSTDGNAFPVLNSTRTAVEGGTDAYVMKIDATGSAAVYSTKLGGRFQDAATGVALGAGGDLFVTGLTASIDFPAKAGFATGLRGIENAFVVRITPEPGPTPPAIAATRAAGAGAGFKVTIKGGDFQPGAAVYLADDAEPWPSARVKRSRVKLTGGAALEAKFPAGRATRIRIVNPDGGIAYGSLVR